MAQWETCRIKYVFVRDAGFFGPPICRWEAEIMAPSGSKVIYKSQEFKSHFGRLLVGEAQTATRRGQRGNEQCDEEHDKMIGHLGNEGWQLAQSDPNGWTLTMQRNVIRRSEVEQAKNLREMSPSTQKVNDPQERLRALVRLRNEGLISEEEFQQKRKEILHDL